MNSTNILEKTFHEEDLVILEKNNYSMKFILNNATNELAALFRKTMMVDVPTMAFCTVNVYKNTTMYETFNIIRTLRSIPLKINPDDYIFPKECKCTEFLRNDRTYEGEIIGGCDDCSVCFGLSVVGDWKDDILREVTIKNMWSSEEKYDNILNEIPEIPIVRIKRNEELYLTTRAMKGTGNSNALWSPVTIVSFSKIEKNIISEDEPVYKEDQSYIFYFETVGSLSPEYILNKTNELYQKQKLILNQKKADVRYKYLPCKYFSEEDQ
jgi:DNA-directed RNA polymerase alpha subunit